MGNIADLGNLKPAAFVRLLDVILFITPGLVVLYYFDKQSFTALDPIKLALLAASITLPLFLVLFYVAFLALGAYGIPKIFYREGTVPDAFAFSFVILGYTTIILYTALAVAYVAGLKFTAFVVLVIALALLTVLATFIPFFIIQTYRKIRNRILTLLNIIDRLRFSHNPPPPLMSSPGSSRLFVPLPLDESVAHPAPLYTRLMATNPSTPKPPTKKQFFKVLKKVARKKSPVK